MINAQGIKALRIFACYFEKGGKGSGRKKDSVSEFEESNFSNEVERKQREEADEITLGKERRIKKLYDDLANLDFTIIELRKQLAAVEKDRVALVHANRVNTQLYKITVGKKAGIEKRGKAFIQEFNQKKKEYDELINKPD